MLSQGFEAVYHLHGGILKYLEEMPLADSLWEGDCFVFDRRVALSHGLKITGHKQCYACRRALTQTDLMHKDYQIGVSCHHCIHITSKERQAAFAMRQKQVEQAVLENRRHIGETR